MPRDANGNYALPDPPVVTGTTITSTHENDTLADIAAEMEDSLSRSGKGGMLVPFQNDSGDAANPGMTFANDVTAGFFEDGGDVGVSVGGAEVARFDANGITKDSLPALGQQVSTSSGAFTTISTAAYVDVTNLSVTITTTGRPVMLMLQPEAGATGTLPYTISPALGATAGYLKYQRSGVDVATFETYLETANSFAPFGSCMYVDTPVAGTYTYKLQAKADGVPASESTVVVAACVLVAYEL